MSEVYDDIIIGAGQAGPALAEKLSKAGRRVAIFEREKVGGTCVNYGCIPTKALVASARAAHMARRGPDFGVETGEVRVDMERVNARMKAIAGESRHGVESWLEGLERVDLIRSNVHFVGERRVSDGVTTWEAERIFLNVGGRARTPTTPGIENVPLLTNREMLELKRVPEHLVVLGGGYIGLEFSQMFRRFGSRVTIIERNDRLIKREDPEISEGVEEILSSEGIEVAKRAESMRVRATADGVAVDYECDGESHTVEGSDLLVAAGRVPNTEALDCAAGGVDLDERGFVVVDEQLRTSAEGVWAMGDCNGEGAFTHTSWNDHEIVAANLLDDDPRRLSDRFTCYGLFIDPPLGRAGMTEQQARDAGHEVRVGRLPMSRVGRARERSETQGFMKVVVDAESDLILGAAILGVNGDEVIHVLLDAMYAGVPYTNISRAVYIHPTVAELVPTMLQNIS